MSDGTNVQLIDFSGQHRQWREENERQQAEGIRQYRDQMQEEYRREKSVIDAWRAETDRNAAQWASYRQSQQRQLVESEPDVAKALEALSAAAVVVNDAQQDVQRAEVELAKHTRPSDKAEVKAWAREHAALEAELDAYRGLLVEANASYQAAQAKLATVQDTALERLRRSALAERDKCIADGRREILELREQLQRTIEDWDNKLAPIAQRLEVLGVHTPTVQPDRPVYSERDGNLAAPWQRPQFEGVRTLPALG